MNKYTYTKLKNYDKTVNNIRCLSQCSEELIGEIYEKGKEEDIVAYTELEKSVYNIYKLGSHSRKFHKEVGYIKTQEGYVAILEKKDFAWLWIIFACCLLGFLLFGFYNSYQDQNKVLIPDDNAEYVGLIGYQVGGQITDDNGQLVIGATVEFYQGSKLLSTMESNDSGCFAFKNVPEGIYMIKITIGEQVITKLIIVQETDQIVYVELPKENVSTEVDVKEKAGKSAVGDLEKEAEKYEKEDSKEEEKTVILVTIDKNDDVSEVSLNELGEVLTDFGFNSYQVTVKVNDVIKDKTDTTITVAIPIIANLSSDLMVFNNNGTFKQLTKATDDSKKAGTWKRQGDYILIYTKEFGEFIIADRENAGVTVSETTVGFDPDVYVDLSTCQTTLYFYHHGTGNSAVIQLIILQDDKEYVIHTSGVINDGYEIRKLTLAPSAAVRLSKGNYSGIIRAKYKAQDGSMIDTNFDMEVTVHVK